MKAKHFQERYLICCRIRKADKAFKRLEKRLKAPCNWRNHDWENESRKARRNRNVASRTYNSQRKWIYRFNNNLMLLKKTFLPKLGDYK